MELVRNYQEDLEEFGTLTFQTRKSGGMPTQYANLNEQQSTLILTFMRNSDVVVDFKKRLVREFYRMKNHLNQPPVAPQLPQNKLQILSQALMIAQEEWKPKADSYDGSYSGA